MHKHFGDEQFDVVTATMCLGEFPPEYLDYVMQDCRRILKPGGRLLIGDECWPKNLVVRTFYRGAMVFFWIPQFLLLRRPFFPIKDLEKIVRDGDLEVRDSHGFRGSSFRLISAVKARAARKGSTESSAVAS